MPNTQVEETKKSAKRRMLERKPNRQKRRCVQARHVGESLVAECKTLGNGKGAKWPIKTRQHSDSWSVVRHLLAEQTSIRALATLQHLGLGSFQAFANLLRSPPLLAHPLHTNSGHDHGDS